jgi:DNA invertase Pin-like site-specific DNA recombinase
MIIGYARVSTQDQDLSLQRGKLELAGVERLYAEKASGAKADRPELAKLLEHVRAGDVVVVARLDRLARNTADLLAIADKLNAAEVGLRSLAEPWADTTSNVGRMMLTILAGVAEFERGLILERTGAGRTAAMAAGVKFGRPSALKPEQVEHARKLVGEGASLRRAAGIVGVHHKTLGRALEAGA